jgi:hypothetical protein
MAVNFMFMLVIYMISRWVFYFMNTRFFPDVTFVDMLTMSLGGLRFDISALCYLNLLCVAMQFIPLKCRDTVKYQRIVKIIFLVINIVGIIVNTADIVYFEFGGRRTTWMIFSEFGGESNLGTIFLNSITGYWQVWLFGILMILAIILLYYQPKTVDQRSGRPARRSASPAVYYSVHTVLFLLAMSLAEQLGTVTAERRFALVKELQVIPDKIAKILEHDAQIADLSKVFTYTRNFLYLGRGYNYPVALEGALKLKEISYIHAEGYPAAEMKHGPIALIDEEMPVVVIAPRRGHYDKILSNIQEVKARGGRVISVITEGDEDVKALSDWYFEIPDTEECFEPILSIIPLQLLAYHIAIAKGRDVDQPRNLAKSVTVE